MNNEKTMKEKRFSFFADTQERKEKSHIAHICKAAQA
jgi:hypothetical protein